MSHTSVIKAIVISDVRALRAAIKELKREGVKCDLLENAVPRAYYTNQDGLGKADFVVKLDDSKYDIGLYQNKEIGGYEARADLFNASNNIAKVLGVTQANGKSRESAALGKLYQKYAVNAAERQALEQGYSTQRNTLQDGSVQLTLTAAA